MLDQPLGADPGSTFQYENAGYVLLGRIVEAVTGRSYEAHVRESVLEPLGIQRMRIGGTRQSKRIEDEVRYHGHETIQSPFPDVGEVPRPYAAAHLPAIDAAGGWVGPVADLLRFARGVGGTFLEASTVAAMTTRPEVSQWDGASQYYATGWYVIPGDEAPALWHNGSLPGSYAFLYHDTESDRAVATLMNSRPPDASYRQFNAAAQQAVLRAAQRVESWPDHDRFEEFD